MTFTPGLPVTPVSVLGRGPTDREIWEYARRHALVIVAKDADFSARIILATPLPWVVQLRIGNLRRRDLHALPARV